MNFGILLNGTGKVWIDNISFEVVGKSTEKFNDSLNLGTSKRISKFPKNLNFDE
ncbi:hypothetical protein SAMN04488006_0202, partial [Lutibacter maritimus]